jgi:thymidylate synthase ThyX
MQITFPRFLLPEFNTHRVFSRNFRSSRAVPIAKLIEEVRDNPYEPAQWLKNKPGMQATEPMSAFEAAESRIAWQNGANLAADTAERLLKVGTHKQWANRVLEPYLYVHGVVTATDWDNFFELRDHPDAQPEIQALAKAIKAAFQDSKPQLLQPGQWHMPFVDAAVEVVDVIHHLRNVVQINPTDERILKVFIKLSVARCARTSYLTHEGTKPTIEKDLELYDRLVGARPLHASPAEHQATPDGFIDGYEGPYGEWRVGGWQSPNLHGNFRGFIQNRKILEQAIS